MANMAVVLVLGARPSEQASLSGPRSIVTVAARPSVLVRRPVTATIGTPKAASEGSSRTTSSVSPLCDRISRHVFVMDAAQVAVDRFGRMEIVAARAGRGERGGDLLADQTGLAHAADDHAAAAIIKLVNRPAEFGIQPPGQAFDRLGLHLDDLPGVGELIGRSERAMRRGGVRGHRGRHP